MTAQWVELCLPKALVAFHVLPIGRKACIISWLSHKKHAQVHHVMHKVVPKHTHAQIMCI